MNNKALTHTMFRKPLLAIAALTVGSMIPAQSYAIVTYYLGVANIANPPPNPPGNYGQVSVNLLNPTTATVTFQSSAPGIYFGAQGAVAFNANPAVTFTIGTPTFPAGSTPVLTNGGSGNEDGFGNFSHTVDDGNAWPGRFSAVTLTLTGAFASESTVLTNNASGYAVAAHILVTNATGDGAIITGYATGNGTTPPNNTPGVPDGGSSMVLLGIGLSLLALLRRKLS